MPNDTTNSVETSLAAAAKAFDAFATGPVASTTKTIEDTVTRSFRAVENTIARAAISGRLSINQLVNAVLADFERIAVSQFIVKPIEGIVSSLIGSLLPIGGARASGGPVAAGAAYLVGERGPELFVPSSSGAIAPNESLSPQRASIVMNVQARDAESFLKSETQIAAMLTRAVSRGQRNL